MLWPIKNSVDVLSKLKDIGYQETSLSTYDFFFLDGRSGAVDRVSDFGPRGPWFDSPPVHISLWP